MMRTLAVTVLAFTLVFNVVAAAQQQGHEHRGFWIGFGFGGGINLNQGLDGEQLGGGGGYLRLGGTPSQKVLLGFEALAWVRDVNGVALDRSNGTFSVQFYPSEKGGTFLKGGVGLASISRATSSGNSTTTSTRDGFGLTTGAGWDVKIGRNLYLTPNVDLLFQWFESQKDSVTGQTPPGTNTIVLFTLGLTWH